MSLLVAPERVVRSLRTLLHKSQIKNGEDLVATPERAPNITKNLLLQHDFNK